MKIPYKNITLLFIVIYLIFYIFHKLNIKERAESDDNIKKAFSKRAELGEKIIKIVSSSNIFDIAFFELLFTANNILYTIQNYHFGTLLPGPFINNYNNVILNIFEGDYDKALEIVETYYDNKLTKYEKLAFKAKLRNITEFAIGSWFIPNNGFKANILIYKK